MSGGQIAALIAACALLVLVGLLAVPLLKLGRVLDETRLLVADLNRQTPQLLAQVNQTVTGTNAQLAKVDTITDRASTVAGNAANLSSLFAATLGGPVVRVAAFTYGVRRVFATRRHHDAETRVKAQVRDDRRERRSHRRAR